MRKVFKHKTLWWIANFDDILNWIYKIENKEAYNYIDKQLIENSQDREEVIEKDWIDKCIDEIHNNDIRTDDEKEIRKIIREIILKHAPNQQMFTYNDISDFAVSKSKDFNQEMIVRWTLEMFLKQNNLLYTDNND